MQVQFCLAKRQEDLEGPCSRATLQGTLIIAFSGTTRIYSPAEVEKLFSTFGDLRSVRPFERIVNKFFVEFYDQRKCLAADRSLNNTSHQDAQVSISLAWDYSRDVRDGSKRQVLPTAPKPAYQKAPEEEKENQPLALSKVAPSSMSINSLRTSGTISLSASKATRNSPVFPPLMLLLHLRPFSWIPNQG